VNGNCKDRTVGLVSANSTEENYRGLGGGGRPGDRDSNRVATEIRIG